MNKGVLMQEYIPLKEYAIKNKISIFQAVKLVKDKKVESITKVIDGKEKVFIKNEAFVVKKERIKKEPTLKELYQEIESLKKRVKELEEKLLKK
jgi:hypothetical protein